MLPDLHAILDLLEGGFSQLRILVAGDLILDRYIIGEVERISPEAPVPVIRHAERYERLGGAANFAMDLAWLGCKAFLAGFWGSDNERAKLDKLMVAGGIDTTGIVTSSLPTVSKTRIIGRTQQMLRLDIESRDRPLAVESQRLLDRAVRLTAKMHAVILSDYAKGALTQEICEAIIGAARCANIPVLVDPKTKDFSKYSGATTICPNLNELSVATGVPAHETAKLLRAAKQLLIEHDFAYLTVTMSEKGIPYSLSSAMNTFWHREGA